MYHIKNKALHSQGFFFNVRLMSLGLMSLGFRVKGLGFGEAGYCWRTKRAMVGRGQWIVHSVKNNRA
jgi:hypothetical protein